MEPVFAGAIERQVYLQEKLNKFEFIDEAYYIFWTRPRFKMLFKQQ